MFSGPASKKRKVGPVEWKPAELPALPILVNKKAIPMKTRLCVFMADQKKKTPNKVVSKADKEE